MDTLEELKITENLQVSVEEAKKEVDLTNIYRPININGKEYKLDMAKAKWSQMIDWSAELASGMVLKTYKDERGEEISEIALTKEYAIKKNKVATEIIRTLFSLDIAIESIPVDTMFELLDIIDECGFLERLERLNRGNSTKKKSSR